MAQITQIETQKKNKERCSIYVDGTFYCGIKLEIAVKYHLKAGMEIEKSQLDEIQFEEEKSVALDMAMNLISGSMKTEKQMDEYLQKKGYRQLTRNYVMEKLLYYGLLDDLAYCRAYISSVKGKGRRALSDNLYKRGAKREAIEEALEGYEEDDGEAYKVLTRYLRGREITKENLMKAFRYLLSKGYSYDTAKACMEHLESGQDLEVEDEPGPEQGDLNEDN